MIIGEVVEFLISIRDRCSLSFEEDDAVCYACNILDQFPRLSDAESVLQGLKESKSENI